MINLQRVSYVRLGTRDIEGAIRFATDVLGLEVAEVSKGAIYFKSDEREHTLCYFEGDPHDQAVAFEVGSRAASVVHSPTWLNPVMPASRVP